MQERSQEQRSLPNKQGKDSKEAFEELLTPTASSPNLVMLKNSFFSSGGVQKTLGESQ